MAAVDVVITGALYDKTARTMRPVVLVGEASYAGLGVGGGPMPGGDGDHIWGGGNEPFPTPPIHLPGGGRPPHIWGGGNEPFPTPPIWLPGQLPPNVQPPEPPAPGAPTTPMPPPQGSGGWPVQPIRPPEYIVVWYPGLGPVVVAPPAPSS